MNKLGYVVGFRVLWVGKAQGIARTYSIVYDGYEKDVRVW